MVYNKDETKKTAGAAAKYRPNLFPSFVRLRICLWTRSLSFAHRVAMETPLPSA